MLSLSVHRQLSDLLSQVHQLIESVHSAVASTEVDLRADATRRILVDLEQMTGAEQNRSFGDLARHPYWLNRFYREGKPDRYASDISDIRDRDLPA